MAIFLTVTARVADDYIDKYFTEPMKELRHLCNKYKVSMVLVDDVGCHVEFSGALKSINDIHTALTRRRYSNTAKLRKQGCDKVMKLEVSNKEYAKGAINEDADYDDEQNVLLQQLEADEPVKFQDSIGENDSTDNYIQDIDGPNISNSVTVPKMGTVPDHIASDASVRRSSRVRKQHSRFEDYELTVATLGSLPDASVQHVSSHEDEPQETDGIDLELQNIKLEVVNDKPVKPSDSSIPLEDDGTPKYIIQYAKRTEANDLLLKKLAAQPSEDGKFECPMCSYANARIDMTREHFIRCHGVRAWQCTLCNHMFALKKDLTKHLTKRHQIQLPAKKKLLAPDTENLSQKRRKRRLPAIPCLSSVPKFTEDEHGFYQCTGAEEEGCDFRTRTLKRIREHFVRLHRKERPFACDLCAKTFALHKDLVKHKLIHDDRPAIQCDICGKVFKNKEWYRIHRRAHDEGIKPTKLVNISKKAYKCPSCNQIFARKEVYLNHIEMEHLQTKEHFKCPVCSKAFIDKGKWKSHSFMHLGIRPHKCSICGKGFPSLRCLDAHKVIHKEKKHKCPTCSKAFCAGYKLREHMKFHDPKKGYVCSVCGKGCSLKSQLVAHEKIHFDVWPYVCKLCNKQFKFRFYCKRHLMTAHGFAKNDDESILQHIIFRNKLRYSEAQHGTIKRQWIVNHHGEIIDSLMREPTKPSGELSEGPSGLSSTEQNVIIDIKGESQPDVVHSVEAVDANDPYVMEALYSASVLASMATGGMFVTTDNSQAQVLENNHVDGQPIVLGEAGNILLETQHQQEVSLDQDAITIQGASINEQDESVSHTVILDSDGVARMVLNTAIDSSGQRQTLVMDSQSTSAILMDAAETHQTLVMDADALHAMTLHNVDGHEYFIQIAGVEGEATQVSQINTVDISTCSQIDLSAESHGQLVSMLPFKAADVIEVNVASSEHTSAVYSIPDI